jgi:hypothetical protein
MAPYQQRKAESAVLGLIDQFHQVDFLPLLASGEHDGMSSVVDPDVSLGPSLHVIER